MSLVTCNEKGETHVQKAAFRCRTCGHLSHAAHAGECAVPITCPVCKAGVEFDAASKDARDAVRKELVEASIAGDEKAIDAAMKKLHNLPLKKTLRPDNWEVLADLTAEQIAEYGLEPHHCERHVPHKKGESRPPQDHERVVGDGAKTKDSVAV